MSYAVYKGKRGRCSVPLGSTSLHDDQRSTTPEGAPVSAKD
jgi:hypothetical protein